MADPLPHSSPLLLIILPLATRSQCPLLLLLLGPKEAGEEEDEEEDHDVHEKLLSGTVIRPSSNTGGHSDTSERNSKTMRRESSK
eukprot:7839714-Pyramimonas_sp.AAC.1